MAALYLHATSGEVAMQITTRRTILQIKAAANDRLRISGWGVSFKGTSVSDAPVLVTVLRQSTAGTGLTDVTATNLAKKNDGDPETIQTIILQGIGSGEPTAGALIENFEVHPQMGYRVWYPQGQEIIVPNGERLGFCITTASLTYACDFEVDLEE